MKGRYCFFLSLNPYFHLKKNSRKNGIWSCYSEALLLICVWCSLFGMKGVNYILKGVVKELNIQVLKEFGQIFFLMKLLFVIYIVFLYTLSQNSVN